MPTLPDLHPAAHATARAATAWLRLPIRGRAWRGENGNWQGAGIGSSIDFQDHRPYLAGDDPRYIDWQAYARSGHYLMKLYREEVSPRVDLLLDASASMFFDSAKERRVWELFYFAAESAFQIGASLRAYIQTKEGVALIPSDALFSHRAMEVSAGRTESVPWRTGSLRVWISDLLFPEPPEPHFVRLATGKGRCMVLAPFAACESQPDWSGNLRFIDCESGADRIQNIPNDLLIRYRNAWERHFALWRDSARRHGALLARISAEGHLETAVRTEALHVGALELRNG
jgi:hypothetical protein